MKKVFIIILVVALILAGLVLVNWRRAEPKVEILAEDGRPKASFVVELAKTPEERAKGLMFRSQLPQNQGMLFIFDREEPHWFWMKNTLIPLDMIFIDQNQKIVGIVNRATPESEKLLGGWKSKFVLEINGSLAEKYGIKEGDRVNFRSLSLD